jgi:ribosomal protein S18 acetylase RimI-like enzyme
MPLPILRSTASPPTAETLIRYFDQTESDWTAHLAEKTALDFGTAWANPQLDRIHAANRLLDVALPDGMSAEEASAQAEAHYAALGVRCAGWIMNPSAPQSQTAPMVEYLLGRGYARWTADIMYLERLPASLPVAGIAQDLKIIPARASFKHCQELHDELATELGEPLIGAAEILHLDDPHYDALLALREGRAVAHVGVLASGEIGRIDQLYVSKAFRNLRIGTTMMSRAMEICARSLFRHVLLGVEGNDVAAIRLCEKFGFHKIGQTAMFVAPGLHPPGKS